MYHSYLKKKASENLTAPSTRHVSTPLDPKSDADGISVPNSGHTSVDHGHSSSNTIERFPLVRRKTGLKPIRPTTAQTNNTKPELLKEISFGFEYKDPVDTWSDKENKIKSTAETTGQGFSNSITATIGATEKVNKSTQTEEVQKPSPNSMDSKSVFPAFLSEDRSITVNNTSYIVTCIIGKGGSSKVYQVANADFSELFALKVVHMDMLDPVTAEGYLNEVALLQKLQGSEHVVQLIDFEYSRKEQKLFLVMEKGDTDLASLLRSYREGRHLGPLVIRSYWEEMLLAVNCIHANNVIHADLKPANFLLVRGRLKLIDFGIATSVQPDMTSVVKESQAGTYNYMAPEAIKPDDFGFKISKRSDIWSLGCILYNMVYGYTPFQHITTQYAKLSAIVNESHVISFPECRDRAAVDVIRLCLKRSPKERPDTKQLLQHPFVNILNT